MNPFDLNWLVMFGLLLFCHALADYPLQGDFLSRAKNRFNPIVGVPWYHGLFSHAAIHAGFVGIITGSLVIGLAEFVVHAYTDDTKCRGRISYDQDQLIHVACKVMWVCAVWLMT